MCVKMNTRWNTDHKMESDFKCPTLKHRPGVWCREAMWRNLLEIMGKMHCLLPLGVFISSPFDLWSLLDLQHLSTRNVRTQGIKFTFERETCQSLLNFTFCALTNIEVIIRVIVLPLYITIFLFHFIKIFFFFLTTRHSLWDLSSLTRDGTHAPCSGKCGALISGWQGNSKKILKEKNTNNTFEL